MLFALTFNIWRMIFLQIFQAVAWGRGLVGLIIFKLIYDLVVCFPLLNENLLISRQGLQYHLKLIPIDTF